MFEIVPVTLGSILQQPKASPQRPFKTTSTAERLSGPSTTCARRRTRLCSSCPTTRAFSPRSASTSSTTRNEPQVVRVCNYSSAIYSINSAARAFKPTTEKEQKKKSRLAARINNLRRISDCDGALRYFCFKSWYIFASSGAMAIGDVGKGGRSSASRVYVHI